MNHRVACFARLPKVGLCGVARYVLRREEGGNERRGVVMRGQELPNRGGPVGLFWPQFSEHRVQGFSWLNVSSQAVHRWGSDCERRMREGNLR